MNPSKSNQADVISTELQVLVDNEDSSDSQSEADNNHNIVPKVKRKYPRMHPLNRIKYEHLCISRSSTNRWPTWFNQHQRILSIVSALFYALASFLIIVINKIVLTTYQFPSYHLLGLGQMIATILILTTAKKLDIITYPSFTKSIPQKIFPMPLLYVGNLLFGLGGTQKLSLPMFTVLRRFAIPMTLIAEYLILR